jgi:hypothetical protein
VSEIHRRLGRIGAYTLHARYDSWEITQAARTAFAQKFLDQADPDGRLSPPERERRANQLRSAYYARLAKRSWEVRMARLKRERREDNTGCKETAS